MNAIFLLLADVLLILAGVIYGVKFLRKRNYLCGIEWFIMALSGSHFLLWALFGWESGYSVAHFFDAFSRSFGFPVVAVAGMMAVTHNYASRRASRMSSISCSASRAPPRWWRPTMRRRWRSTNRRSTC